VKKKHRRNGGGRKPVAALSCQSINHTYSSRVKDLGHIDPFRPLLTKLTRTKTGFRIAAGKGGAP
jgi:hypothetical protein